MTTPNLDPRRLRFPQDRTVFIHTGPNAPILSPPRSGLVVYADHDATQLADITTLQGAPIPNSTIHIGEDSLMPEFLGPPGHVMRLWMRLLGDVGETSPLDAQAMDHLGSVPLLVVGDGAPTDDVGTYGSMYLDRANWALHGPKTESWPAGPGTSIRGPQGPAGGTWEHSQVSPSTTWTIQHPLNYRPNVAFIDSAGSVVVGDTRHPSPGVVVAEFSAPFAGTALLS